MTDATALSSAPGGAAELRQATDLPLDSHLHTDLSSDSRVPIDAYARMAAKRAIVELAITDHLDFDPRAPNYAFTGYQARQRIVREAAERWAGRVAIRFGVEISYESGREDAIRAYLARHPYDFIIGSVHVHSYSAWHSPRVEETMRDRSLREAVTPYFEEVAAAARSGLFDTVGHLDYVKKYLVRHVRPEAFRGLEDVYEAVLRTIVERDVGLEINTSGLRQPTAETYPPGWVIDRFRELGGRRVTVGSDAHAADHFTFGLERAYRFAAAAGFASLSFRRATEPVTIPIPTRFVPHS